MLKKEQNPGNQGMAADALDDQHCHHRMERKQDRRIFRQTHLLKRQLLCNFFITGILFFLQNNLFGSHIHDGLAVAFKEDAFRLVLRIDEG